MLSSGFTDAPVTKYAIVSLVVSSIAVSLGDVKYLFYIQVVPHLWRYAQVWRLVVWQTCYTNSTELLFAAMMLYHLRIIERLWGSRKLASFILSTLPFTTFLPPLLLAFVVRPLSFNTINYLPAGPTAIIFALLAQYYAAIPHTFRYKISSSSKKTPQPSSTSQSQQPQQTQQRADRSISLLLSDKSTTYLLALQLSLSQFPSSILPAAVGWLVGYAWRAEILPGAAARWRVPGWLYGDYSRRDDRSRTPGSGGLGQGASGSGSGSGAGGNTEGYEGLRRRLEGESRAAAAAASGSGDAEQRGAGGSDRGGQTGAGAPLVGQVLDRFRGAF
ncbi:hypothetical protein FQN54_005767 [Arachnomyces sp. PD_36]|nr:hypothetical protein FQN54_005767 [Arachnomyces sp. PD_36]